MPDSPNVVVLERHFDARGVDPSVPVAQLAEVRVTRSARDPAEPGREIPIEPFSRTSLGARLVANTVGTFISALGASLLFLSLAPIVVGFRPVAVASGSMAPALRASDVVILDRPYGRLPEGAVIDYESGDGRRIHRIVEVVDAGYRTKGDANPAADSEFVPTAKVNGFGVMVVPFVGAPGRWLDDGRWLHLAALAVVVVSALWVTPRRWLVQGSRRELAWTGAR